MTTITVTNPWTKQVLQRDITGLTQQQLDAYAQVMTDESREAINDEVGDDCTPESWLAAWAARVGADEAGRIIIGS